MPICTQLFRRVWLAAAGSVVLGLAVAPGLALGAPKILIVADMEGLTGVVTADQLGPEGFEYERFRQVMTAATTAVNLPGMFFMFFLL